MKLALQRFIWMKISRRILMRFVTRLEFTRFSSSTFFQHCFPSWLILLLFTILISLFNGLSFSAVTLASILARAISSVVNFTLNHKVVFKRGQSNSAIKYFTLVVVQIVFVKFIGNSSRKCLDDAANFIGEDFS